MSKLIKLPSVVSMTGLSKSSIYAMMKNGLFPRNILIGERAVAWVEAEIEQWIKEKISSGQVT